MSLILLGCGRETPQATGGFPRTADARDERAPRDSDIPYGGCISDGIGKWTDEEQRDWNSQWRYDDVGLWAEYRLDADADDAFESFEAATRDESGLLITYEIDDDDVNATVDQVWTYGWSDGAVLLTLVQDYDANGADDYIWNYEYDSMGRQALVQIDAGLDGTTDGQLLTTWSAVGDELTLEEEEYDWGLDGPDSAELRWWTGVGTLQAEEWDTDADGRPEETRTYEYDGDGQQVAYEAESYVNGIPQERWRVADSFDEWGRLSARKYDYWGDGSEEYVASYSYLCAP